MDQNPNEASASPKQQAVERIRQAANVLVTVRSNPSVDELAACIGFTLMLNKLGKHATAVFSGEVPSTLEFLKPDETLEANTDSLRDFIISLDKSKADKLRYKVEENVVRIFITPYRTSITDKDLEFTQGDFNVDVVVALGVSQREELDQAIVAHGRILHDAAVITMTAGQHESSLGAVNWQEAGASSLSEMLVSISEAFQGGLIDAQMATAFLTGIVAETQRFSNPKTTPKVMTMAAQLMAAGANQQLIANELQKGEPVAPAVEADTNNTAQAQEGQGSLSIEHGSKPQEDKIQAAGQESDSAPNDNSNNSQSAAPSEPFLPPAPENESFNPLIQQADSQQPDDVDKQEPAEETTQPEQPADAAMLPPLPSPNNDKEGQIHIDQEGNLTRPMPPVPKHKVIQPMPEPPEEGEQPSGNSTPLSGLETPQPPGQNTDIPGVSGFSPPSSNQSPAPGQDKPTMPNDDTTLTDIEQSVHSPHLSNQGQTDASAQPIPTDVSNARSAVNDAISQAGYNSNHPEPRMDVGSQFGPQIQQPATGQPNPLEGAQLPPTPEQPQPPQPTEPSNGGSPPPPVPPPMYN